MSPWSSKSHASCSSVNGSNRLSDVTCVNRPVLRSAASDCWACLSSGSYVKVIVHILFDFFYIFLFHLLRRGGGSYHLTLYALPPWMYVPAGRPCRLLPIIEPLRLNTRRSSSLSELTSMMTLSMPVTSSSSPKRDTWFTRAAFCWKKLFQSLRPPPTAVFWTKLLNGDHVAPAVSRMKNLLLVSEALALP